jgi:ATP-binding cassette subfamily B protein
MSSTTDRPAAKHARSLSGLAPFLRPYRGRIALALLLLVLAALATLAFPIALRGLIDAGFAASSAGERLIALREHFLAMFAVGAALGLFSASRFYMVTWLGERVTADLRNAVYTHVLRQSPEFFETTQTGEVLSRITTDTTVVQTVVGSSLSMGLRNLVMGVGALVMLVVTNPYVMGQVLGLLVLIVAPALYFGRRVRKLSRASQDRVADTSAIAAEVLNAVTVVQSYTQEGAEASRFSAASEAAFDTALKRTRIRSFMVAFIITAVFGAMLWGLYQGTQAVIAGKISAGHLGQTVVYVTLRVRHRAPHRADGSPLAGGGPAGAKSVDRQDRRQPRGVRRHRLPLPLAAADGGAGPPVADHRARRNGGARRPQRCRQDDGVPAAAALLRPAVGRHPPQRRAHARAEPGRAARQRRPGTAGQRHLLDDGDGEHPLRPAGGDRRGSHRRGPRRVRRRLHPGAARGLCELLRGTRRAAVWRAAPAHQHRAGHAEEPAVAAVG